MIVSIALLGALLLLHRCGRYLVARACGIRVARFRIGFGPTLWRRTLRSGTSFEIAAIPLSGSVAIRGLNLDGDAPTDDPQAFRHRPVWQQLVTILAGPATDWAATIVAAMLLYSCHGVDAPRWYGVGSTERGSPAEGKLAAGDRITALDHVPLFVYSGPTLSERVNAAQGAPVVLTIERDGTSHDVAVTPREERAGDRSRWLLGIRVERQDEAIRLDLLDAAGRAAMYPFAVTATIARAWYRIVAGSEQADYGGPVRMVEEFSHAFGISAVTGLMLVMMLAVYLGLMHLLPIPGLEGAWLVALAYRLVRRRRPPPA